MTRDTLVIDIETKNTFADVGRDNFDALEVSLVGLYSYKQNKFFHFWEEEMDKLGKFLSTAEQIIGFSISRFDLPVLKKHFDFDLFSISRFDILDEIELLLGRRVKVQFRQEYQNEKWKINQNRNAFLKPANQNEKC